MFKGKLIVALAVVVTLMAAMVIFAQGEPDSPFGFLRAEDYTACGLGKLNHDEQARLGDLLLHTPLPSYCEAGAAAFMKEEGWRQVRIIGGYHEDEFPNELRLFLQDDYNIIVLDPTIAPAALDPGVYWGKSIGSQWTLLYPDGRRGSFSAVDRY